MFDAGLVLAGRECNTSVTAEAFAVGNDLAGGSGASGTGLSLARVESKLLFHGKHAVFARAR